MPGSGPKRCWRRPPMAEPGKHGATSVEGDGKHILLILGSPKQNSLCHALAEAYAMGARREGHIVRLLKLGELEFDPVLHEGYDQSQLLEPDLIDAQRQIHWAEHLVFVYPVWWLRLSPSRAAWLGQTSDRPQRRPAGFAGQQTQAAALAAGRPSPSADGAPHPGFMRDQDQTPDRIRPGSLMQRGAAPRLAAKGRTARPWHLTQPNFGDSWAACSSVALQNPGGALEWKTSSKELPSCAVNELPMLPWAVITAVIESVQSTAITISPPAKAALKAPSSPEWMPNTK
jgi:hypothetical protein